MLEQLRVLEAGFRIAVGVAPDPFPPGVDTPDDLARAVRSILEASPERRVAYGEAGRRAVRERYLWDRQVAVLLEVYRAIGLALPAGGFWGDVNRTRVRII